MVCEKVNIHVDENTVRVISHSKGPDDQQRHIIRRSMFLNPTSLLLLTDFLTGYGTSWAAYYDRFGYLDSMHYYYYDAAINNQDNLNSVGKPPYRIILLFEVVLW